MLNKEGELIEIPLNLTDEKKMKESIDTILKRNGATDTKKGYLYGNYSNNSFIGKKSTSSSLFGKLAESKGQQVPITTDYTSTKNTVDTPTVIQSLTIDPPEDKDADPENEQMVVAEPLNADEVEELDKAAADKEELDKEVATLDPKVIPQTYDKIKDKITQRKNAINQTQNQAKGRATRKETSQSR